MKKRIFLMVAVAIMLIFMLTSCELLELLGNLSNPSDSDKDTETSIGSDTGNDTGTDIESDTDTDTNKDSDIDSDSDLDSDSDFDSDSDNTGSDIYTDTSADTDTNIVGSFNTIYVYSLERVSILQTWIAGLANYNEVSDSSKVFHLTDEENLKSGQIQKNQSIEASLICAYHNANKKNPNIKLEYNFAGFIVRNYQIKNEIFKIGDLIISIYDNETNKTYGVNNPNELKDILNKELTVNDKITFVRDREEIEVTVDKEFDYYENQNKFYWYAKYDIKKKVQIHHINYLKVIH
jgi:hypothetical protein